MITCFRATCSPGTKDKGESCGVLTALWKRLHVHRTFRLLLTTASAVGVGSSEEQTPQEIKRKKA